MPTAKHPDHVVVLGMYADDALNVYVRDGGELHQAARISSLNGATPLMMTEVMANLAEVFDWRKIVGAATAGVLVPPPAVELPRARTATAVRAANHPAGKAKRHAVTIEQVIDYVIQHSDGVRVPQIAEALLPGDKENRHTISNRLISYFTRVARTNEMQMIHKVVGRDDGGLTATYYPGPPT